MKILIDADGCPVVKQTIEIAKEKQIEVMVFCDTSHIINSDYAKTVTVSKGEKTLKIIDIKRNFFEKIKNRLGE